MPNTNWQQAATRAAHVVDERERFVEGAIIDWLIRTGQWDPAAEEKVRRWLERQSMEQKNAKSKER